MALLLILVAIVAGLSLLPEKAGQKGPVAGLPLIKMKKRHAQGLLFGALVLALGVMRLYPFAFIAMLVGLSVMGMSYWREKTLGEELDERSTGSGPRAEQRGEGSRAPRHQISKMSVGEAMDVLGLEETAKITDVDTAYRRLMAQIHPDKGGTDYLAAKINEAREVLKKNLVG